MRVAYDVPFNKRRCYHRTDDTRAESENTGIRDTKMGEENTIGGKVVVIETAPARSLTASISPPARGIFERE